MEKGPFDTWAICEYESGLGRDVDDTTDQQNLVCSFMRWGLFRLQESPRYLVARGREDEAVIALQAIATYNERPMDISSEDVQGGDAPVPPSAPMRDKKNSELPTPDGDERSPLPDFEYRSNGGDSPHSAGLNRSGSRGAAPPRYDAVGMGPAPPKRQEPIRTGSAFYAPTPGAENLEDGIAAHLRRSLDDEAEEAGLMAGEGSGSSNTGEKKGWRDWGRDRNWMSWWDSWVRQMGKLFVPQWRRTVLLMWVIWGSMSFGKPPGLAQRLRSDDRRLADRIAYTMFNVWLPAVLESRASGEGDAAIKQALQEFVLYSCK